MNDCLIQDRAKIVVGSKAQFKLFLIDEQKRPISLSPYTSGKLIFCNAKGVRTEIVLTVPGANPDRGEISVTVPAASSANADDKWTNADVELNDGSEDTVIPLNNKFEILKRNCPPVTP